MSPGNVSWVSKLGWHPLPHPFEPRYTGRVGEMRNFTVSSRDRFGNRAVEGGANVNIVMRGPTYVYCNNPVRVDAAGDRIYPFSGSLYDSTTALVQDQTIINPTEEDSLNPDLWLFYTSFCEVTDLDNGNYLVEYYITKKKKGVTIYTTEASAAANPIPTRTHTSVLAQCRGAPPEATNRALNPVPSRRHPLPSGDHRRDVHLRESVRHADAAGRHRLFLLLCAERERRRVRHHARARRRQRHHHSAGAPPRPTAPAQPLAPLWRPPTHR